MTASVSLTTSLMRTEYPDSFLWWHNKPKWKTDVACIPRSWKTEQSTTRSYIHNVLIKFAVDVLLRNKFYIYEWGTEVTFIKLISKSFLFDITINFSSTKKTEIAHLCSVHEM